jgi:glycosyltransferase involved in cell wall biosynthesis
MVSEQDKLGTIMMLSATETIVPRIRLEKATLEKAGFFVDVMYRQRIFWRFTTFITLPIYYLRAIKICLRRNIGAVHITHILQLPLSPVFKIGNKIVVYDAYDRYSVDISEQHFKGSMKKPIRLLIEFFENFVIKMFVDAVFVVSSRNEFLFKRYKQHCKHTECLYNVPSKQDIFCGDLEKKYSEKVFKIAYVGGIAYQKGSQSFIQIADLLRQKNIRFEFHLIGSFSSQKERDSLLSDIRDYGLADCFFFHGFLNYSTMMNFLYQCHIGLSLYIPTERLSVTGIGTSRKNFTYMCAGMVVIAADVGEMAYVIKEENSGVVITNPNNLDQLVSIIECLEEDRMKSIGYAKNGIESVKKSYNWETEEQKVLSVYKKLGQKKLKFG